MSRSCESWKPTRSGRIGRKAESRRGIGTSTSAKNFTFPSALTNSARFGIASLIPVPILAGASV